MSISSQQYAYLANGSREDRPVGIRNLGEEERAAFEGAQFQVMGHVNNRRNGYRLKRRQLLAVAATCGCDPGISREAPETTGNRRQGRVDVSVRLSP